MSMLTYGFSTSPNTFDSEYAGQRMNARIHLIQESIENVTCIRPLEFTSKIDALLRSFKLLISKDIDDINTKVNTSIEKNKDTLPMDIINQWKKNETFGIPSYFTFDSFIYSLYTISSTFDNVIKIFKAPEETTLEISTLQQQLIYHGILKYNRNTYQLEFSTYENASESLLPPVSNNTNNTNGNNTTTAVNTNKYITNDTTLISSSDKSNTDLDTTIITSTTTDMENCSTPPNQSVGQKRKLQELSEE